jgi:hypothetical protein
MKKLTLALALALAGAAHAGDLTVSGFTTIAAGKAYDGTDGTFNAFHCPCFIANYEHGTTYEKNQWSLKQESLAGLQLRYQFNDQLSATAQAVVRPSVNKAAEVDWAYLSYDVTPDTTVHVGRRRLPIYAFSDSVYIGYSLPWIRVPQDIYGWEVGAFNGVTVTHRKSVGDWAVTGSVFAGQESTKKNLEMQRIYYDGQRVDDAWKHILGANLDVSNDIFGVRLIYMQNSIDITNYPPGEDPQSAIGTRQRVMGISASADIGNWLVRAESNTFMRPALDYRSKSWTATVGYKIGDFTPLVGYSDYTEKLTAGYNTLQIDNTRFVALRWDFRKNMDLKVQWDSVIDRSAIPFTGNAKVLSVALDAVF